MYGLTNNDNNHKIEAMTFEIIGIIDLDGVMNFPIGSVPE
jgi:hypothetical protein